jgi:hypothetical protein
VVTIQLTLGGIDRLQTKLDRLQNIGGTLALPIRDGCMAISSDLRKYPPISEANLPPRPPPGRFYIRGVGGFYLRKNGTLQRTSPSQRLGVSWSTTFTNRPDLARGVIATGVTYAPYVHDAQTQASFHKRRGWPTVQALFQKHGPRILAAMSRAIEAALRA